MASQGLAEGGAVYDPLFKPCWYTQGPFVRATQGVRVDGISFTEFAGRSGDSPRYGPERSGSDALLRAHGGAGMFAKQIMREQGAEGSGDSPRYGTGPYTQKKDDPDA